VSLLALGPSLGICVSLLWPVDGWYDEAGYIAGRDFANFWMAARLAAEGRLGELYDLAAYHAALRDMLAPGEPFMNFSYMPNALPLVRPLGELPYGAALALWQGAGLLAFSAAATGSLWPLGSARAALVLLSPVVILVLGLAQATFFLALLFVGAFRLLPRRPGLAGVLLGLLTVKPHLGILLPVVLLLGREWRAMAFAALTALVLVALSLAAYGLEPWQTYFANTVPYQARVLSEPFGFVWTLMISPYAFLCQLGAAPSPALIAHGVMALAVAGAAILAISAARTVSEKATVAALAAVLLAPYSLAYDLAIPAAALIWHLAERPRALSTAEAIALPVFWALPVVLMPLNALGLPVMPPVLALLFAAFAWDAVHRRAAGTGARGPAVDFA
jgi:hypothetical protein